MRLSTIPAYSILELAHAIFKVSISIFYRKKRIRAQSKRMVHVWVHSSRVKLCSVLVKLTVHQ
jgi:hypothetical protein